MGEYEILERRVSFTPEEAYQELRKILLMEKTKIIEDYPPKSITVEQGSWLGYSPKTCKKIIRFDFIAEEAGTRIVSDTSWTSGTIASTILGYAILGVFSFFLWWLVSDMKAYITGLRSSLGGWFLELFGYTGFRQVLAIISILELLVFIIVGILLLGILTDAYSYAKRETVAERFLSLMPQSRSARATP